ncbi:MAG: hypothetical protein JSS00_14365 [Proteobacteria bacterium]|nr:hypothetical protein [Pseudomonadota bacterium]
MRRVHNRSRHRAGLGLALLVCAASLLLGLGLDFASAGGMRFWIDERPGGLALFGAAVAVGVAVIAQAARLLLGRREKEGERRDADA